MSGLLLRGGSQGCLAAVRVAAGQHAQHDDGAGRSIEAHPHPPIAHAEPVVRCAAQLDEMRLRRRRSAAGTIGGPPKRAAGETRSRTPKLSVALPMTKDPKRSALNAPGGIRTRDLLPSHGGALSAELPARDHRSDRRRVYVREPS